jgi:hypothetical protein
MIAGIAVIGIGGLRLAIPPVFLVAGTAPPDTRGDLVRRPSVSPSAAPRQARGQLAAIRLLGITG